MNLVKLALCVAILFTQLFNLQAIASSNGGNSERQCLLAIDEVSYTVLSVERLGHFTHYQYTNRLSLKRYSLQDNKMPGTDVVMESQINSSGKYPLEPLTVISTDTQLTTLQAILGERVGGFVGYVRAPKYRLKVSSEGIFMDKNGSRTVLMPAEQLRIRIPNYLELADYNAFEVVGILGSASSHYFVVVRSNTWGIDIGSFEQVLAVPNP